MLSKSCGRAIKSLAFISLFALGASSAQAGFTTVNAPSSNSELGHGQILSQAYGGLFHGSGVDFSNGTLSAQRLHDTSSSGDVITQLLAGSAASGADQCWSNGVVSARAIARFAGFEQTLGIMHGENGGSFNQLFTVTGSGMNVSGSVAGLDLCDQIFRFARGGGGETFTSLSLDNIAAADQMVSYRLTGPDGMDRFVLFFEDASAAQDSDWDFNDLVVEITATSATLVPLPPAVWSALAVLVTGGLWNARGRIIRWLR